MEDAATGTDELERLASELEGLLRSFRSDPSNCCRTGCRRCPFGYRREWAIARPYPGGGGQTA